MLKNFEKVEIFVCELKNAENVEKLKNVEIW